MWPSQFTDSRNHCLLALTLTCMVSLNASADDTDVYKALIAAQQKPNILFVLDYSNSMQNSATADRDGPTRISVLKSAMNQLVDDNVDTINAGLGSFFQGGSTGIRWPISDLTVDANSIDPDIPAGQFTAADIVKQRVAERGLNFGTTTVEALVEAAQYFRGDPVTHNDTPVTNLNGHRPPVWNATTQRYEGRRSLDVSIAAAYSPSNAYSEDLSQTFYCNDYSASGGPNYCESNVVSNCTSVTTDDPATAGFERTVNLWGDYQRCEYSRVSNWETPRFNSPITDVCEVQENAIVLISDGLPTTSDNGASLQSLVGDESSCEDFSTTIFRDRVRRWRAAGNCGPEIVKGLATQTVNPFLPNSYVKTYTVGFNVNADGAAYLDRLASDGDGEFYLAEDPDELTRVLNVGYRQHHRNQRKFFRTGGRCRQSIILTQ